MPVCFFPVCEKGRIFTGFADRSQWSRASNSHDSLGTQAIYFDPRLGHVNFFFSVSFTQICLLVFSVHITDILITYLVRPYHTKCFIMWLFPISVHLFSYYHKSPACLCFSIDFCEWVFFNYLLRQQSLRLTLYLTPFLMKPISGQVLIASRKFQKSVEREPC